MFHLLAYSGNNGIADSNVDIPAVLDPTFTRRGGGSGTAHYIFTEQYQVLAAQGLGADLNDLRFNAPSMNAWFRHHIFPVIASANQPVPTWAADYREYPLKLPINEEIAVEMSGVSAAGGDPTTCAMWISSPDWNKNIPGGVIRMTARFSASITGVANAWSNDGAITFAENLRGGTYAVLGCRVQNATTRYIRLNFPRMPLVQGRKFFPGDVTVAALGTVDHQRAGTWLGEWGRFHSFELPQIAGLCTTAGAKTLVGFMDLVYLGEGVMV